MERKTEKDIIFTGMQEKEVGGLQKREKKNKIDEKKLKKNKSSVMEELNEYGAKKTRVKSNEDKKKKYKGSDNVECTVNDNGSRYFPNSDSNNVISRVTAVVETSKDDGKNAKEKGKIGGEMDKLSYNGKKSFADDGKIREDKNHSIGEHGVKAGKKAMNYKEVGKDAKGDSDVVASTKEDFVKERKALNDKDGYNKKNRSGKNIGKGKGEMMKVTKDKVRKDKKQTSGEGKKIVEHVEENENGKHTESSLTHPIAGEPIHGRREVEDSNVTCAKGCTTLNSKRKSTETKVVVVEMEKHGKKKSKKAKKEQVGAIKHISKESSDEIFDIGEQKKYEEVEKVNDNDGELNVNKRKANADPSIHPFPKKKSKSVSFSEEVEVFPFSNDVEPEENCEGNLVRGKRYSKKEDAMIKKAIKNYIKAHDLGEKGLDMVLNCQYHPELRGLWKEIGAALPWRPVESVWYRAHNLYERGERTWDREELDIVKRFHEKHGSKWKALANVLGKHRHHVRDAWRRVNMPNEKRGPWSQDEYQALFDLVNLDLRMKASAEKQTKHGMLRDNIAWTAIGEKIERRCNFCCTMWYDQLASPMVAEGLWANSDDYKLLEALVEIDACCMEDVDWDNLLEHRPGEACLNRWKEMTKYIGEYRDKPFSEQVELLSTRYDPSLLEVLQR